MMISERSIGGFLASALVALMGAGLLFAGAGPASAHAALRDSNPRAGATVSSPPSEVWAEYTEPPQQGARLDVIDPCGTKVGGHSVSVFGYRASTPVSADRAGTYRVSWRVVSELDGHATSGSFSFTSTGGSPCPGAGSASGSGGSGGSGSGGGSGSAGSGSGGGTGAANTSSGSGGASSSAGSGGSREGDGPTRKARGDGKKRHRAHSGNKGGRGAGSAGGRGDEVILTQGRDGQGVPASDELPLDWLLASFALSALIGAVGGQIYALIVGPDDDRKRS